MWKTKRWQTFEIVLTFPVHLNVHELFHVRLVSPGNDRARPDPDSAREDP